MVDAQRIQKLVLRSNLTHSPLKFHRTSSLMIMVGTIGVEPILRASKARSLPLADVPIGASGRNQTFIPQVNSPILYL